MKKLPVMRCDAGCGDCCGVAPVTEEEYERVVGYARSRGIAPVKQGVTCPYYQKGVCQVYEVRPIICVVFGHSPRLGCSRGYNRNVPESVVIDLVRATGRATRVLHEVVGMSHLDAVAALGEGSR